MNSAKTPRTYRQRLILVLEAGAFVGVVAIAASRPGTLTEWVLVVAAVILALALVAGFFAVVNGKDDVADSAGKRP